MSSGTEVVGRKSGKADFELAFQRNASVQLERLHTAELESRLGDLLSKSMQPMIAWGKSEPWPHDVFI